METQIFQGIDSVDPQLWQAITHRQPFASSDWCRFAEAVFGGTKFSYYVIVKDEGGQPLGGAIFYVYRQEQVPLASAIVRHGIEAYLKKFPLIVCRTAPITSHRGYFLPDDPKLHSPILAAIRDAALTILRKEHGSFLLFDYLNSTDLEADWGNFIQVRDFQQHSTLLSIQWATFEEYLQWMRQRDKGSHEDYRRHTRRAEALGITVKFHPQITERTEALALIQNVETRHRVHPHPLKQQILDHVHLLPNCYWMTAHIQGRLVGCELLLFDQANAVCKPILYGRDYEIPYLYFYSYYEVIRYAIETLQVKTFIGESDSYVFKERCGFEIDARNQLVFYGRWRIGNWLAMRFL